MKVKVYLTNLGDRHVLDEHRNLELKEGATVASALRKLKIPVVASRLPLVNVNSKRVKAKHVLKDGDIITFFSVHVGG